MVYHFYRQIYQFQTHDNLMDIEEHTKKAYDKYGEEYEKTRKEKAPERAYNEFLEKPCMINAVSNIKDKTLLDIGCGSGEHIKEYLKKGAKAEGVDISSTMIEIAKKNLPNIELKVGTISNLPFQKKFDVVTSSLTMNYVNDLKKAFAEVSRVLKKGGMFYYSDFSIINLAKEHKEDEKFVYCEIGFVEDKKTGARKILGNHWLRNTEYFEMVPGMIIKNFRRPFSEHLHAIVNSGLELIDFIDCKPTEEFKKYNPKDYEVYCKFPAFSIYVCRKK